MGKSKWKRNRRKQVERTERVKPPPEAAQHHRPWPMMMLLHLGPDANGIDADEFEAGIEIVETFKAITAEMQVRGTRDGLPGSHEMSDRIAFMGNVWFEWTRQIGPVATHIVEQIEDAVPIHSPDALRLALRRWLKVKRDLLRAVDKQPSTVLTYVDAVYVRGDRGHALPISRPSPPTHQVTRTARAPTQAAYRCATAKRA
jgi:hypothetical protein